MNPPSRSAESLCWFMLTTLSLRPVFSARNWTLVVFPTPVSPTRRTGSLKVTALATASRRLAACLVMENTDWGGEWAESEAVTGTRTRPTCRPAVFKLTLGLCVSVKYRARSLLIFRVKAISLARASLMDWSGMNLAKISTES